MNTCEYRHYDIMHILFVFHTAVDFRNFPTLIHFNSFSKFRKYREGICNVTPDDLWICTKIQCDSAFEYNPAVACYGSIIFE